MRHYERIIKAQFGQNDNIFLSLQSTSSCFPTFLLIFVIYLPKFGELSIVSPNRSTVLSSGDATPLANSDSLTLSFCERNGAFAAAWLAQWDKRRPVEQNAVGSNPRRTNTQRL